MMLMMQPSLGGHLAGDPNIETLQRSLTNLAIASGRPAINPGQVTGTMNDATMAAVSSALGILTEELPGWLYLALQAAMIAGSTTSKAKAVVTQYASQLAMAANAAAVKMRPGSNIATFQPIQATSIGPATTPTTFLQTMFGSPWYKSPLGIALIGLGLFGFYKFFIAAPKAQ